RPPDTLVTIGDLTQSTVFLACAGFVGMTLLDARRVTGAIVISIIAITTIGLVVGDASWGGGAWLPPSPAPTLFALDVAAVFELGLVVVVLTFLFFDFFDTAGTLTSVAVVAGRVRDDGSIDNIGRAVFADSVATTAGSLIGTSSATSYIESGAGIREGGRTGLTAVTCAVLFLLCLFLAPLVKTIPSWAAASALVFVGTGFVATLRDLDWEDAGAYVPAVLTAIVMPFTFSIANGIAIGFISYAVINTVTGNARELHPAVWLLAAASLLYFLKDF
ncbi:MAG: NCS2 family permease, partial [Rhodospirillales bacterium]|nr:NCS2 family permease [Rhodospirillales bacterium]